MRLKDILRTIENNFYLAFILLAILGVILLLSYFLIYKKFLKGNKSLNKRFRKFSWMFGSAFLMTLFIEAIQLITGYGIFELDDIFNNLLGAIIGYGIVMTIINLVEKRNKIFEKSIIYLMPLFLLILGSITIVTVYNLKEYGNLYISHNYKINMKDIDLTLNTDIEDTEILLKHNKYRTNKVPIYKAPICDKNRGEEFFIEFLQDKTLADKVEIDPYNDMAIYWISGETTYSMWLDYKGGSYRYEDFSSFDEGVEKSDADKERVLKELENFNISLPDSAIFNIENKQDEKGIFEWTIDNYIGKDYIINGNLSVSYYNDNTIKDINNGIIRYEKEKNVKLKSKKQAYEEFKNGKFNFYNSDSIDKIIIESISLSYMMDSKGFYQPIYKFESEINGEYSDILIPAL